MSQERHLGGSPAGRGGKFKAVDRKPVDVAMFSPEHSDVLGASTEQLWGYVRHPDYAVRLTAVRAPNLSTEQLHALADPDSQPAVVRIAVAGLLNPGVASRAAADPHPLVRAQAAATGWDLSRRVREALFGDPEVRLARSVLATA